MTNKEYADYLRCLAASADLQLPDAVRDNLGFAAQRLEASIQVPNLPADEGMDDPVVIARTKWQWLCERSHKLTRLEASEITEAKPASDKLVAPILALTHRIATGLSAAAMTTQARFSKPCRSVAMQHPMRRDVSALRMKSFSKPQRSLRRG